MITDSALVPFWLEVISRFGVGIFVVIWFLRSFGDIVLDDVQRFTNHLLFLIHADSLPLVRGATVLKYLILNIRICQSVWNGPFFQIWIVSTHFFLLILTRLESIQNSQNLMSSDMLLQRLLSNETHSAGVRVRAFENCRDLGHQYFGHYCSLTIICCKFAILLLIILRPQKWDKVSGSQIWRRQ